ncbi:hypothetical protein MMC11_002314 [Xylographa trunciseda]|nr:hypothetical protein [Xylographa trunciseda]
MSDLTAEDESVFRQECTPERQVMAVGQAVVERGLEDPSQVVEEVIVGVKREVPMGESLWGFRGWGEEDTGPERLVEEEGGLG